MVWLALVVAVVTLLTAINLTLGVRRLTRIDQLAPLEGSDAPLVSIVVPARNEARRIEAGVGSLLAQRYPALEIVVVDDRSTDGTGAIVDRLAGHDPRIVAIHLDALPPGWLGKNHALFVGAGVARGEWLLFADADIVMAPDAVSRIVRYAIERGLDNVSVAPRIELPGPVLQAFAVVFTVFFCAFFQPWRASDPGSRFFIGVGAFNLVRRTAYERAGTHRRIALRPDDDVKLGKILKRSGSRQELVTGAAMIRVEWYHSVGELIEGLEKNAFAGLEYSVPAVIASVTSQLVLVFGPLAGLAAGGGPTRVLFGVAIGIALLVFAGAARELHLSPGLAFLYPVVVLLFDYIVVRTMVKNLADGGLEWRDTFYPLDQLRSNRV